MKNNLFDENYFKKGLNDLYTTVVNLDETKSEEDARLTAANKFYELFSNANLIIKGSEYLPYQSSSRHHHMAACICFIIILQCNIINASTTS